jgi:hypothetical protein
LGDEKEKKKKEYSFMTWRFLARSHSGVIAWRRKLSARKSIDSPSRLHIGIFRGPPMICLHLKFCVVKNNSLLFSLPKYTGMSRKK